MAINQTMDSEYQPISRVERLKAAHPWLLEAQAWKLLSIKYVLMGPDLNIHNPDHLELIMQEWTDHLVQMDTPHCDKCVPGSIEAVWRVSGASPDSHESSTR